LTIDLSTKSIPAEQHGISQARISPNALKVCHQLQKAGYDGYLVGGCVRDLILGYEPKDFDVVTNATPEQVRALFSNCRLIGRRFRLAHVRFGREIIEVATYRAGAADMADDEPDDDSDDDFDDVDDDTGDDIRDDARVDISHSETGRILRDNVYGTREQDAARRDFTINALYYDPKTETVLDDVSGFCDLREGQIRIIGDANQRYREDPVRMLRALRFAAKLGLRVNPSTLDPIDELAELLTDVPPARLFEEALKLFHGGCATQVFELIRQHGLYQAMFPGSNAVLDRDDGVAWRLIPAALNNTDARINSGKHTNPAFLFGVVLWPVVRRNVYKYTDDGMAYNEALRLAASDAIGQQIRFTSIPKRFSSIIREIWALQPRLERRNPRTIFKLLEAERFRAAYDFLCLRVQAGELPEELCQWWTQIQEESPDQQHVRVTQLPKPGGGRRRNKSRKRRGKKQDG